MTTDLALPITDRMHLVASTPHALETAQQTLVTWLQQRVRGELEELREARQNLAIAKRSKWNTVGWRGRISRHKAKLVYYRKLMSALRLGYYIVPNFPLEIFAVRTARDEPRRHKWETAEHWVPEEKAQKLPPGKGRYVSPQQMVRSLDFRETKTDRQTGKRELVTVTRHKAMELLPVDFPFRLVKPEVLGELSQAMKRKLFDQFGVVPAGTRRGDPIILGQILHPNAYHEPVSFFISWWLDTNALR